MEEPDLSPETMKHLVKVLAEVGALIASQLPMFQAVASKALTVEGKAKEFSPSMLVALALGMNAAFMAKELKADPKKVLDLARLLCESYAKKMDKLEQKAPDSDDPFEGLF